MALYKTRQLLANYSQQSVRDLSVSRLEKLYAPVVAQRRQADLDNEQAFETNIPHIEHVKRLLAQELEQMATEENAHMPITDVFSALQVVKQAKVSENDIGVRALETMLTSMWRKDRTASITSAKFTALNDHFRKNYPRSAVCEVLEKIGESGYLSLEISKLAALAQDIGSQADYERVILENGLQSNSPNCKKARQFILALVNGDDERPFERTPEEEEKLKVQRDREKGLDEENYNRDLKLRMQDKPFHTAQSQNELNYGFAIIDGFMEDADDDEHPHSSTLDSEGITQAAMQIERNMLRWLKKNVGNARDEGHDSRDDLVGSVFVEKGSEGHQFILDALEAGEPMSFGGYSNLPFDATEGVDEKYAWYFNPELEFFDGPEEESEEDDFINDAKDETEDDGEDPDEDLV